MRKKGELYDLVAELHGRGFTSTPLLAQVFRLSDERIRKVLIDLGIERKRTKTIDDVARELEPELIARIDSFVSWNTPT